MSFLNLLVVSAVAVVAPLVVRAIPVVRVPSPVLEIVAGIVLGPSVLGWVTIDPPVQVLALIGLAFLLFLAGLEIDVHRLRGRPLRLALAGFALSFAIASAWVSPWPPRDSPPRRCSSRSRCARRRWGWSSRSSRTPMRSTATPASSSSPPRRSPTSAR